MESSLCYNRRRSGYEPSDTETDWHEDSREINGYDQSRAQPAMLEMNKSPARIRHNTSPQGPGDGNGNGNGNHPNFLRTVSPLSHDIRTNASPFIMSEQRGTNRDNVSRNACPFSKSERRINPDSNRENINTYSVSERRRRVPPFKLVIEDNASYYDKSQGRERSYSRTSATAPRLRFRERSQRIGYDQEEQQKQERDKDVQHKHALSVGEINEMVAHAKITRMSNGQADNFNSINSISPGDIFFSRDYNRTRQGNNKANESFNQGMSQTTTISSSVVSRQSRVLSVSSARTSASTKRFVTSRRKSRSDSTWFSCIKKSSCKTSCKSPAKDRPFDEASFISKAVVLESLRPLWADKHQPVSLTGFTCHENEAQLLQTLASSEVFPHILLKGPPGTGKKALTSALLREIYGDPVWNISHDLRYFHILESRPMQVVVHVSSSPHHVELNVYAESKAAYALTALVKEISSEYAATPEFSVAPTKADYKVLVLYDVDKAAENMQHLIKWIMDCYSDSCKLVLCCEDDVVILDSVKSRCRIVNIGAPATHEGNGGSYPDSQKEGFELPATFAHKIANESKQNIRRAIMALEACKFHNYPFNEDQPIPLGWEETVAELAAYILAEPFPKRLFIIREKIQKLLGNFVHPKLILLKLVGQFLRGVDASLKREIYYWYAYYDKRLPTGTNALLKLEEFVAKFMSICRKSSSTQKS